jgi:uncharacterized protein (DUF983 family)
VCETVGDHFPASESAIEGEPSTLLLCPECDEPFEPQFARTCAACGYDYGVGVEAASAAPGATTDPANLRLVLVVVAMITSVAVIIAYFAWLL